MAVTYGFYNSLNKDRVYNAEQMSAIFDGVITDGVFASIADHMMPVAGTGLQVIVKPGKCWFNSTWTLNDAELPLTIATADVSLTRIDAVVVEINSAASTRANSIKVVKGTPSANPAKPTLTATETLHQYALGYVTVPAGATSITAANVEVNVGKTGCPFVTSVLQQTDITTLFNQWEAEFDAWFENVQNQLSGDIAANLQNQINHCVKIADKASDEDIVNGTADKWVDAQGAQAIRGYVYDETTKTIGHITTNGIGFSEKYDLEELYAKIGETYVSSASITMYLIKHFIIICDARSGIIAEDAGRVFVLNRQTGAFKKLVNISTVRSSGTASWYLYFTYGSSDGPNNGDHGDGLVLGFYIGTGTNNLRRQTTVACWEENGDIVYSINTDDSASNSQTATCLSYALRSYSTAIIDDYILQSKYIYPHTYDVYSKQNHATKLYDFGPTGSASSNSSYGRQQIVAKHGTNIIVTLSQYVNYDNSTTANNPIVMKELQLGTGAATILRNVNLSMPVFANKTGQMLVPICYDDEYVYLVYCWDYSPSSGSTRYYRYKKLLRFSLSTFAFIDPPTADTNDYVQDYLDSAVAADYLRSSICAYDANYLYFNYGYYASNNLGTGIMRADMATYEIARMDTGDAVHASDANVVDNAEQTYIPKLVLTTSQLLYPTARRARQNSATSGSGTSDLLFDRTTMQYRSVADMGIPYDIGTKPIGKLPDAVIASNETDPFITLSKPKIYESGNKNLRILSYTKNT